MEEVTFETLFGDHYMKNEDIRYREYRLLGVRAKIIRDQGITFELLKSMASDEILRLSKDKEVDYNRFLMQLRAYVSIVSYTNPSNLCFDLMLIRNDLNPGNLALIFDTWFNYARGTSYKNPPYLHDDAIQWMASFFAPFVNRLNLFVTADFESAKSLVQEYFPDRMMMPIHRLKDFHAYLNEGGLITNLLDFKRSIIHYLLDEFMNRKQFSHILEDQTVTLEMIKSVLDDEEKSYYKL